MENRYQTPDKKSVKLRFNGMEKIVITEVRARVISQEKGLYKIFYEGQEGIAARAFYKHLGFVEGKLTEEFGSPIQEFVLIRCRTN